eukprot:Tamp_11375.p1 GENE.Tamp_11375~~Tamp_11375.p1  ORF type:complete len:408 (-),score=105.69 Tamp_11375:700-1818(-)
MQRAGLAVLAVCAVAADSTAAFQGSAGSAWRPGTARARCHAVTPLAMQLQPRAVPDSVRHVARRTLLPLLVLPPSALLTSAGVAAAEAGEKDARSAKLAQAMAVVSFTKTVDQATDKALKLQKAGDFKGAEKQWNVVVDTYESGDDGVVVSAQAVYRLGKTLALRADVRSELGQRTKKETKLTEAIDDYKRSLEIVDSAEVRVKLATVLLLVKRDAEAEKEFDAVLEADVGNQVKGRAYNNRGLVKQQQQKWSEAVDDFQQAVSITQGGSPEAMKNLALAKFEAGDTAGSLTMLKQQAKDAFLGPVEGAEDIPAALAAAEAALGDKEQAAKDFAKVKDIRFKDVRFVKEGRLWPPKLVAGLQSLVQVPEVAK